MEKVMSDQLLAEQKEWAELEAADAKPITEDGSNADYNRENGY